MASVRANVWKMQLFRFLISLQFFGGVLMPFFTDWGGLNFTQTLVLQSWFMIWVFALEIPTGTIADVFGRKASLQLGLVANIGGVLAYSFIPNFYIFMFAEFLWALASALFSGADEALLYDSLKEAGEEKESKKILGHYYSFGLAGFTIAAPIGGLIAATLGLRYTMLLVAVPFSLAFLVALTFKEPKKVHEDESVKFLQTLLSGVKQLGHNRILRLLAFDSVVIRSLASKVIWVYQPVLLDRGLAIGLLGVVHACMSGIQIPVLNAFGHLERLTGSKKRYLIFSALIPGIAFVLIGLFKSLVVTIPLLVVITGLGLTRHVLFNNYMHKYIQSSQRATVMSTIEMLQRLASGLLYPLVGLLMDYSLTTTFIVLGVVIVAVSLISGVEEVHLLD